MNNTVKGLIHESPHRTRSIKSLKIQDQNLAGFFDLFMMLQINYKHCPLNRGMLHVHNHGVNSRTALDLVCTSELAAGTGIGFMHP